jgi:hypothetical protein
MGNRRTHWVILALCPWFIFSASAAAIVAWNFNSSSDDADTATGSLTSSHGDGVFAPVGGVTTAFGTVGGARTSDPAIGDDSQLRLRTLPRIDAGNKSAGVEITLDTIGYENLTLSWDQFNSRTASRYWRVQYSIDGVTWTDHESIVNASASTWVAYQVSFAGTPIVNGRPDSKIRIVQEFESTATGAGVDAYTAVDATATYSTAGSWWLDMISISDGVIAPPNAAPIVSTIAGVVLLSGTAIDSVPFTVSDPETPSDALQIAVLISDPEVINRLFINGSGSNRFLSFQAAKVGETEVTVQVSDNAGQSTEIKFMVVVVSEPIQPPPSFFLLWNFNSTSDDGDNTTGNFEPAIGNGSLSVLNTENHNFGSVAQGRTSDPAAGDNSMLRISGFPRQGESNRTSGIEIAASTVGRSNVVLFWDQYNSSTASRLWRIQYTTNGSEFLDFTTCTNLTASAWQRTRSVSFRDVPGAANNSNFVVRLVSEFDADSAYAAVSEGSNYSSAGTLWLDMVGFSGELLPDEAPETEEPEEPEPEPEQPPILQLSKTPELRVLWPLAARNYFLESKEDWLADWVKVEIPPEEKDDHYHVPVPVERAARFFRLRRDSAP